MSSRVPLLAALLVPALFGACYYPDTGDPSAETPRHAAGAGKSGRRRPGAWVLVRYWTGKAPVIAEEREERPTMASSEREAEEAGIRVAFPRSGGEVLADEDRSILIREETSGFLALARKSHSSSGPCPRYMDALPSRTTTCTS